MGDWTDVCQCGKPAGGQVRQDDIKGGSSASAHDAGAPSPGILNFLQEVVYNTPPPSYNSPQKPDDFPTDCRVDTYPGRGSADVHFEGRAADVFFNYNDSTQRVWGDWLFDWCVENCTYHQIQGVIFGNRQWFSETHGGNVFERPAHDHYDHVHIELNCDGAAQR